MKKQTKLILKGLTNNGVPFTKEIHTLDEVKSSGNYVVIAKNVTTNNGLPQIIGKTHNCFCCEAQLNVTCCYPEDETQSNTAYGQTLTICDRETGTTNSYIRTITPGKNNNKWSLWQIVATGDIETITQYNNINETISNLSDKIDSKTQRTTALHFNYTGDYPFSQKAIEVGADKMIIAGYIDIEYETGKAYCFSVVRKVDSDALKLYKKDKDITSSSANVKWVMSFSVSPINDSPYYMAKAVATAGDIKSWLILDWENVQSYDSLYDYDGIALSPSLFKNGGLSSHIEKARDEFSEALSIETARANKNISSIKEELNKVYDIKIDYNNSTIVNQFQINMTFY